MRLLLLVLASWAFASTTTAMAAGYGPAGCGLGSIVLGNKPGFMQVFAATTNGTSGSQSFGITSGTSNCVSSGKAGAFNQQREFLSNNLTSLSQEAAQGNGETLRAFAATLGCTPEAYAGVAKTMQAHHQAIFAEAGVDNVLFATHEALRSNEQAVAVCPNII